MADTKSGVLNTEDLAGPDEQLVAKLADPRQQEREQRIAGLRRAITDMDIKIKRTIRNFELVDEPDEHFVRDISERRAELRAQREQRELQLAEVERRTLAASNPALLDAST